MDISAQHGFVTITQEYNGLASGAAYESQTSVSGALWQVNAALSSMEYVSAADWHGWDKISIVVTDLGYDGVEPNTESETYYLHVSVAAVNDAPVLKAAGFEAITIVDEESSSGDETAPAFLVPAQEDTVTMIAGVTVSDVDTEAEGLSLNRPDGFFATLSTDGMGNGAELLAVEPRVALSLSCAYGAVAFGADSGGLVAEQGDLDGGGNMLSVTGKLSNINAALVEGIIYTPSADWNGIDVVEVRLPASMPTLFGVCGWLVEVGKCDWLVPGGTQYSSIRKNDSSVFSTSTFAPIVVDSGYRGRPRQRRENAPRHKRLALFHDPACGRGSAGQRRPHADDPERRRCYSPHRRRRPPRYRGGWPLWLVRREYSRLDHHFERQHRASRRRCNLCIGRHHSPAGIRPVDHRFIGGRFSV